MRLNKAEKSTPVFTHGGGRGERTDAMTELERTVATCLLWEPTFYEPGNAIANRIVALCKKVPAQFLADLSIHTRTDLKLRHVPLFLVRQLARLHPGTSLVSDTLFNVIQRPDELGEFLKMYWMDGKEQPISNQVKKGLARSFGKFSEYQFAKWNRDSEIKLRDVMFLVHPDPGLFILNPSRTDLYSRIANQTLTPPDTWEVALSGGADKKETFTRLLEDGKLGYMALLMNLRNMDEAGVNQNLIEVALMIGASGSKALPFRFIAAAKAAPRFEKALGEAMVAALSSSDPLPGKTILVIDVSGSMQGQLSGKSKLDRIDAACGLAILLEEICEDIMIYATAGNDCTQIHATRLVPARKGFALSDAIHAAANDLGGGGIFLTQCMDYIKRCEKDKTIDRVVVLTDEQDCETSSERSASKAKALGTTGNYIINVASYENGIAYSKFTHINGWSEHILDFIRFEEEQQNAQNEEQKN